MVGCNTGERMWLASHPLPRREFLSSSLVSITLNLTIVLLRMSYRNRLTIDMILHHPPKPWGIFASLLLYTVSMINLSPRFSLFWPYPVKLGSAQELSYRSLNQWLNHRDTISRKDEYRLLYVTDIHSALYASSPLSPWQPFGFVALRNTALEVKLHTSCGHRLVYSHWVWEGFAGQTVEDRGAKPSQKESILTTMNRSALQIRKTFIHFLQRLRVKLRHGTNYDESLSRSATRTIFAWALQDGTKEGDSELWKHQWGHDLLAIDTDEEESVCSSSWRWKLGSGISHIVFN